MSVTDLVDEHLAAGSENGADFGRIGRFGPKRTSVAPLPDAALIGPLGEFVAELAPETEADPAAVLVTALAGFGNLVGRRPRYRVGAGAYLRANLAVVVVGGTSTGRKGTSLSDAGALHGRVDPDWWRGRRVSGLGSGEGLIVEVADDEADPNKDRRALVVATEFAQVLRVMDRRGSTLGDVLRDALDGADVLRQAVKNAPLRATGAHVSLIGHITPAELRALMADVTVLGGLANRLLWIEASRSRLLPFGGGLSDDRLEWHAKRVRRVARAAESVGDVVLAGDARSRWPDVYADLNAERPGLYGSATARAAAQVLRISMLYALSEGVAEIRGHHLDAALAVWGRADRSAASIFGDRTGNRVADAILDLAREVFPKPATRTDVRDRLGRHASGEAIDTAVRELVESGLVSEVRIPTGGRSATGIKATDATEGERQPAPADPDRPAEIDARAPSVQHPCATDLATADSRGGTVDAYAREVAR